MKLGEVPRCSEDLGMIESAVGALWTDRYARMLQEILDSGISAMQAYCIGIATVYIVESLGTLPSRSVLLKAAKCSRIPEAIAISEAYIERTRRPRKGESDPNEKRTSQGREQKASKPAAKRADAKRRHA